jgi:flagellar basal body-associated protein FliL
LEEFLTNTANNTMYVRAKIAVRLSKDFDEAKLKDNMGDVRDAVLLVLNSTAPADITDSTKRWDLKKRLAKAMNDAIASLVEKPKTPPSVKPVASPDWDSETGPIYEVRFNALATQ